MKIGERIDLFVEKAKVSWGRFPVAFANAADEYVVIELKDVPQAVQDAAAKNCEGSTIKEAHVETAEDGTKTYKLILVDADQQETILLFNEKGEPVKEEAAQ